MGSESELMLQWGMALPLPPGCPGMGTLLGPSWLTRERCSSISLGSAVSPAGSPTAWVWGAAPGLRRCRCPGDVVAQGCPCGGGCAREAEPCQLPLRGLVAREAQWQHRGGWGHCSPPTVEGCKVLQLAQGGPTAAGAPQGSTRQRHGTMAERRGGWWRRVGARPLDAADRGLEEAATRSPLQTCTGEQELCWAGGTLQGHPSSRP